MKTDFFLVMLLVSMIAFFGGVQFLLLMKNRRREEKKINMDTSGCWRNGKDSLLMYHSYSASSNRWM